MLKKGLKIMNINEVLQHLRVAIGVSSMEKPNLYTLDERIEANDFLFNLGCLFDEGYMQGMMDEAFPIKVGFMTTPEGLAIGSKRDGYKRAINDIKKMLTVKNA